ncbi:MAG: hypothetical protein ACE5OY_08940 [Candidatus Bathyarchaeia archaeon]
MCIESDISIHHRSSRRNDHCRQNREGFPLPIFWDAVSGSDGDQFLLKYPYPDTKIDPREHATFTGLRKVWPERLRLL